MRLYLLSLVNLFLLLSCKKHKPADPAFFIRSTNASVATVNTQSVVQGSASNKITDLFLYVDGKFQGVYPLGNLMPIVNKNNGVTINIFAGIKNNGISDTRVYYPLYDYATIDTLVESGKTIERSFSFKYGSGVNFALVENFDINNQGIKIIKSPQSDADFNFASAADSYEGRSLELALNGADVIAQVESSISYALPISSPNVYLELNYKCTAPFLVGLIGDFDTKEAFNINPQPAWNKIYIQLSSAVSTSPVSNKYKIFFRMLKTDDYPDAKVFLDNIKLLYL